MPRSLLVLVAATGLFLAAAGAEGKCRCREPFYKDSIDFLTRYLMCLEQCHDAQIEDLTRKLDQYRQEVEALRSENAHLKSRLESLENALPIRGSGAPSGD